MTVDKELWYEAARRFAMGDVAESPHPTLPREGNKGPKDKQFSEQDEIPRC